MSIRSLLNTLIKSNDEDGTLLKDLLNHLAQAGGKRREELVYALLKEIGAASAAVLKEPLNHILEGRKLQITLEFIPKDEDKSKKPPENKPSEPPSRSQSTPPQGATRS